MAKPAKKGGPKEKDVVARTDVWTLRFRHSREYDFGLFTWHTKPKLLIRPRAKLLILSRFTAPFITMRADKVKSALFRSAGWGKDKRGLLDLEFDLPGKKLARVPGGYHPGVHHFGMWTEGQFKRLRDVGVTKAGWKVRKR